jgi:hypothetical protein
MNRRHFLTASAGAAWLAASDADAAGPEYQKPVFNLHKALGAPVKIASIELLQSGRSYFVRTRSADGAEGVILTKDIEDYIPIDPDFLRKCTVVKL